MPIVWVSDQTPSKKANEHIHREKKCKKKAPAKTPLLLFQTLLSLEALDRIGSYNPIFEVKKEI